MSSLSAGLAELSPEKRTLLALNNPLSFAQQRLWFLNQWEPGSPVYHIAEAGRIKGAFNITAFEQALNEIVRRHEALRTTFPALDGQPVQIVLPSLELRVPLIDLRHLAESEREAEARRLSRAEALRPFDLGHDALLRITLLRLGEQEYVELFVMHHIVSDGWSLNVLTQEIAALYQHFSAGSSSPLPELQIQYADYALWQRERLQGDVLETQLAYWREQLGGALPVLELPADRPRPAVQTFRGARLTLPLSKTVSDALRALSLSEGVTLFMTMLAAFKTLLYFYSRQEDIVVGTPIANRNRGELEALIGFFINTLVLRTDMTGNPTFRQLISRVQRACLGAYAHQELPFEKLVEELRPERSLSHTPLFQVWFVLQRASRKEGLQLPGLALDPLGFEKRLAKFDLTLEMIDNDEILITSLNYNTDLFDQTTIIRMQENFHALLERIVADPDQQISMLTLLRDSEEHQVAVEWNDNQTDQPSEQCIQEVFERKVEQTPDTVALVSDDEQITYRELNRRANQLAHHLRSLGVGPETCVGVCLTRSTQTVLALLAIFKAGGVYLPLDPEYPEDRLSLMLTDAQPSVLLTEQQLVYTLPVYAAASEIVCLDSDWELIAEQSDENPHRGTSGANLAYVIYTSGSTGGPKGVCISHAGLVEHLAAIAQTFELQSTDRILQFASTAFDVSLEQILTTLCNGACLVLRGAQFWSASELAATLREQALTVVNLPTAYWQQLGEDWQQPASVSQLRLLIVGGEAMSSEAALRWRRGGGAMRLLNAYGPTETVITALVYDTAGPATGSGNMPIGRPLANRSGYVLDHHQQVVPLGVRGELHLGGRLMARGYLNGAELTAERFVPDPFSGELGGRLYRTGDVTRWLPSGEVEFLGRVDHQVKVRGFRVEPGEIEGVLVQHAAVREALVVVREDTPGDRRLVAYVVAAAGQSPGSSELYQHVKQQLPEYMVPAAFVVLESLPLTGNGKVDRSRLPAPEQKRPELGAAYEGPRTALEEALCGIWAEVLGVERVGIGDNFFELGGDSILSLQVIARARRVGLPLTPKQLFEHPSVGALAALAEGVGASSEAVGLALAEQGTVSGAVPLTPIQRWFFARELRQPGHWNMAVLFEVAAAAEPALLQAALEQVVAHHDALRLRFERDAGSWRQYYAEAEVAVPFAVFDFTELSEAEQLAALEVAATELQQGLDLARGPLVRGAHFGLGGQRGARLLVVIHHLVVDAVSWRILVEDLGVAYEQLRQGQAVRLGPKTSSYKRWAETLVAYAESEAVLGEAAYWEAEVQRGAAGGPLPVDHAGGVNNAGSARGVTVRLGAAETQRLLGAVGRGARVQEVLLTALGRVLCGWSGAAGVLVEVEGHGREEVGAGVDVTRTVGWFTTIYPLWLECGEGRSEAEALAAVRERVRGVPGGGLGYGVLKYLRGGSGEWASAGAGVSFNYLGRFDTGGERRDGNGAAPLLRSASESRGPVHSPEGSRSYLIDVVGSIAGGQLQVTWTYSENLHRRETIERLAIQYIEAVQSLLDHCQSPQANSFTPSDFPLLNFNQQQLDNLIAKIGKSKKPAAR